MPMANHSTHDPLLSPDEALLQEQSFGPALLPRPRALEPVEALLNDLSGGIGAVRRMEAGPGAGKTRFLDLVADRARALGWPVVRATGQGVFAPPLSPWQAVTDQVLALEQERRPGGTERALAGFVAWSPERPAGLSAEGARLRWLCAQVELFKTVAAPGLVVLLDDWDMADEASQRALGFIGSRLQDQPILWLVAGREVPLEAPTLELPPFSREEAIAFIESLLGSPMGESDAERLIAHGQGSPWRIETLIAILLERGALFRDANGWVLAGGSARPETPEALARQRAGTLPGTVCEIGGAAALIAPPIRAQALATLLPDGKLLAEGLDSLFLAGVLNPLPEGYRFSYPAYQDLFLNALPYERQLAMHEQLAAEGPTSPSSPEALWRVDQALHADRPDLIAELALGAARQVQACGAIAQARYWLEEGLITLEGEHPDRGRYLQALAGTFQAEQHLDEARDLLDAALLMSADGPERLEALLTVGTIHLQLDQPAEARDRFREAAGKAQALGNADALTLALAGLTQALGALGDADEALLSGETALGIATEASPLPKAAALTALGAVFGQGDRPSEGHALLQQAIALYEAEGDQLGLLDALLHLAKAEQARGRGISARKIAQRALDLAILLGDERAAEQARQLASDSGAAQADERPQGEAFDHAASRLRALLAEAQELVPSLTSSSGDVAALRADLRAAQAMNGLWRRLFTVRSETEVAEAVVEAVFAASEAGRVVVLDRTLAPLVARSREAGAVTVEPAQGDLAEAALRQGRAIASEAAQALPIIGRQPWGVLVVQGTGESAGLGAIGEAAALALDRLTP